MRLFLGTSFRFWDFKVSFLVVFQLVFFLAGLHPQSTDEHAPDCGTDPTTWWCVVVLGPTYYVVAVCALGSDCLGYTPVEKMDLSKEAIRLASATECQELQKLKTSRIYVEDFGHAILAAEAHLELWVNQEIRAVERRQFIP